MSKEEVKITAAEYALIGTGMAIASIVGLALLICLMIIAPILPWLFVLWTLGC